ncbi:uncharacterized protein LOC143623927 [Bidens hawaiensis]|uniref:uncharacterized protein LOC143623927 n=1 Tax=Bidens hawaiensis TaxID=980011 RepID=UPI0040492227
MRQIRWLELIKDYECEIKYYTRKANVVANALSQKNEEVIETVKSYKLVVNTDLFIKISKVQTEVLADEWLMKKERIYGQQTEFFDNTQGVKIRFDRMWIPHHGNLRSRILDKAHKSRYSIHPGSNKRYQDLKKDYWWSGLDMTGSVLVGDDWIISWACSDPREDVSMLAPTGPGESGGVIF